MPSRIAGLTLAALLLFSHVVAARQPPAPSSGTPPVTYARVPANQAAVLKVGNRPIMTFRAQFLTRPPSE